MKINKDPKKTLNFDPEKASQALTELVEVFQKHRLTVGEILTVFGNLGYSLGSSIAQLPDKGPSFSQLKRLYYTEPGNIGVALALQGLTVVTWFEDWERLQLGTEDTKKEGK